MVLEVEAQRRLPGVPPLRLDLRDPRVPLRADVVPSEKVLGGREPLRFVPAVLVEELQGPGLQDARAVRGREVGGAAGEEAGGEGGRRRRGGTRRGGCEGRRRSRRCFFLGGKDQGFELIRKEKKTGLLRSDSFYLFFIKQNGRGIFMGYKRTREEREEERGTFFFFLQYHTVVFIFSFPSSLPLHRRRVARDVLDQLPQRPVPPVGRDSGAEQHVFPLRLPLGGGEARGIPPGRDDRNDFRRRHPAEDDGGPLDRGARGDGGIFFRAARRGGQTAVPEQAELAAVAPATGGEQRLLKGRAEVELEHRLGRRKRRHNPARAEVVLEEGREGAEGPRLEPDGKEGQGTEEAVRVVTLLGARGSRQERGRARVERNEAGAVLVLVVVVVFLLREEGERRIAERSMTGLCFPSRRRRRKSLCCCSWPRTGAARGA